MFDKKKNTYDPDFKSVTRGKVRQWWGNRFSIHCPACGYDHTFMINSGVPKSDWDFFNEDFDRPTFQPSMKVTTPDTVCHSWVKDGRIQFLADCTHALKNQTVDLPDYPQPQRDKKERKRSTKPKKRS